MTLIRFTNGIMLAPEALVYVELPPKNETEAFNEEVWNYVRKGDDKPTLVTVPAEKVRVGENIYNPDGTVKATRTE